MSDSWLIVVVVAIAGLIQGTTGFGFGLFSMGVLVMLMPIVDATVIVAILSLASASLNLWTLRSKIERHEVWPLLITSLPSTVAGVYLLQVLDASILRGAVAAMIVMGCLLALVSPGKAILSKAVPWGSLAGLIGGIFGGAVNTGGPPVVLYVLMRGWTKSQAKGVLSVFLVATGILRVVVLLAAGVATKGNLTQASLALLPAILGCYLGTRIFRSLSGRAFRYATVALLVGLALRLVLS